MTSTARRDRSPATRRTAALLVAAGAFAVILSGCSPDRVGSAAVIDGRTVSSDDLQANARAYLAVVADGDAGDAQRAILQRMIVSAAIDEAARKAGVRVPDGRVAAERDQLLESVGGPKALIRTLAESQQPTVLAPQDIDRWVKDRLLFRGIAEGIAGGTLDPEGAETQQALDETNTLLREASQRVDVEVSPRYGTWDPDTGLAPLLSGGLSQTAAELDDNGS